MRSASCAAPAATTDALVAHMLEQSYGGAWTAVQQMHLEARDDEARNKVREGMAAHEESNGEGAAQSSTLSRTPSLSDRDRGTGEGEDMPEAHGASSDRATLSLKKNPTFKT